MQGFFTKQETMSEMRPDGRTLSCHSCGLYLHAKTPKMTPSGNFARGVMVIGEHPSETDDISGRHFSGAAGRLLKTTLAKYNFDLYEDCVSLNAVNCHPMKKDGSARVPSQHELDCCSRIVISAINQYKPKVIILLGFAPTNTLIGKRWSTAMDGIAKWRGFTIPDQDYMAWLCPVMSPTNILDTSKNEGIKTVWEQDIERALKLADVPVPTHKEPDIRKLKTLGMLKEIKNLSTIAIDYETTGLKPHAKGHRIVTCSVAVSPDKVYVFEMPKSAEDRKPFVDLLKNPLIKKMAHNVKFEHTWSKHILKTTVKNWHWDSMLAAHILDNRPGITGLKFQTYINFGVVDYSSAVSKALQAPESNDHNEIVKYMASPANKAEMLRYNALDSIFEYRLALMQQDIINNILPF